MRGGGEGGVGEEEGGRIRETMLKRARISQLIFRMLLLLLFFFFFFFRAESYRSPNPESRREAMKKNKKRKERKR